MQILYVDVSCSNHCQLSALRNAKKKGVKCLLMAAIEHVQCFIACMLPLIIVAKVETNPPERLIQHFSVDLCMKESFGQVCGAGRRRQRGGGKMA